MKRFLFRSIILVLWIFPIACTKKQATELSPAELVDEGQRSYALNCTSCHNSNPALVGPIGPALKGSSLELLKSRVLTSNYPPGYKPQRETQVMPALPHLAKDIPALHAFLNK